MTITATITSQGQLNIPIKIRRLLALDKSKKALITVKSGKLIVEPVRDLISLGGSLKSTKKSLSGKALHNFFAKSIARDYKSKLLNKK